MEALKGRNFDVSPFQGSRTIKALFSLHFVQGHELFGSFRAISQEIQILYCFQLRTGGKANNHNLFYLCMWGCEKDLFFH